MPLLTLSDADIWFAEKDLVWRSYTMERPCLLAATRRVGFVHRMEFAAVALDESKGTVNAPLWLLPSIMIPLTPYLQITLPSFSKTPAWAIKSPFLIIRPQHSMEKTYCFGYIRYQLWF